MTNSNLNRSKSCKLKETKSLKNPPHEKKPYDQKLELEFRDINDGFRLLYLIFKAEKSDSIEDLQAFCKEAFIFFQYEKRSAENQKGLNACLKDKESMKEFMRDVRNFIVPLVFGLHKN
jgi:hypothetical protein